MSTTTSTSTSTDESLSPPPTVCKVDFSTICAECGTDMRPVHSHYECPSCGWRDSCCF